MCHFFFAAVCEFEHGRSVLRRMMTKVVNGPLDYFFTQFVRIEVEEYVISAIVCIDPVELPGIMNYERP